MLKSLSIQNYALITNLEIKFSDGLSIITGETGAGKSIIMGALSMLLGQRADRSVLRDVERKAIIEGVFDIRSYNIKSFFKKYDIDYDDNTIIRREIMPDGKSRAFINDSPFNLNMLRELAIRLVDLHSQHENLDLGDNLFQLNIVDTLAGSLDKVAVYSRQFIEYKTLIASYQTINDQINKEQADKDYWQYQYDQLNQANLISGEQELAEQDLQAMEHSEEIKQSLLRAATILSDEEIAVLVQLKEVRECLSRISAHYPKAKDLTDRVNQTYIELKDLAAEMNRQSDSIDHDAEKLTYIKERLDLIYSLQQKYKIQTVDELIAFKEDLAKKLDIIGNSGERLDKMRTQIQEMKTKLEFLTAEVSDLRAQMIAPTESNIADILKQLGISNAVFKIAIEPTSELISTGADKIQFLFSANKNEALKDIAKVASGGEISRFMLSLKYLVCSKMALPTIIFDEIDAGVSGEIADKMGNIIRSMASNMQVICITHLPQVASKANNHYFVYKKDDQKATSTYIKRLNEDERLIEIAKMLSGEAITEAAMSNARELLLRR